MGHLSGVEVSLNTQNELLDLAANQLGNIPVELVLKPNTVCVKQFILNISRTINNEC